MKISEMVIFNKDNESYKLVKTDIDFNSSNEDLKKFNDDTILKSTSVISLDADKEIIIKQYQNLIDIYQETFKELISLRNEIKEISNERDKALHAVAFFEKVLKIDKEDKERLDFIDDIVDSMIIDNI